MKDQSIINIGVPIYEGVDSLDTMGAFQVFHLLDGGKKIKPFLITEDGKPITSLEGITIGAAYSFANCPPLDVIFVSGAAGYAQGFPDSKLKKSAVTTNMTKVVVETLATVEQFLAAS